ncbi:monovalent cation/H+ antiporter complex subunit F [Hespellia stercorisuis]|uniref:Multicomponent Na+:H+ antiporter subunit F n=1 Tax=Hespellia stercorisuis DSM 15480 TaxID=1121950 RepID=A0A1M6HKS3_9FIRM|nr:monovalent cation/H+ antiporter complex subunit F [Hespellia stercorisuis]SHJ22804.1 multicomponent Na+:H+ antiporter subunit F [Hespellia stercorisuis DSM 15480]
MFKNLPVLDSISSCFLIVVLIVLAIMALLCLLRSVLGPTVADRIIAVNMMSTMVIASIVILALLLEEPYLLDIALIYTLISFLAVVVLSQIYVGVYREHLAARRQKRMADENRQTAESKTDDEDAERGGTA